MEARPLPYFFRRPLLMVVAAAVFGAVVFRAWVPPRLPPDDAAHYADGEDAILRGTLASDPDFDGQKHRFVLRVRSVQKEGMRDPLPASGLVRVGVADAWFPAGWGDSVALKGPFFRPSAASAPGGFDYRAFLQEKNIHSQMSVFPGGWRRVRRASAASPRRWVGALRDRFFSAYGRRLSPHGAALMSGLVLGKKPASYPAVEDDFRRSGTYHLLVASGSNVGFVIGLWFFVARWLLFLPRRAIWGSAVGWAFLYAGLAGMDPPVVRAALMVSLGIAGYLLAREDRVEQAVGFSMGVFLLLRPRALFEAGFQMSYAATLGVVLAVPALEERLSGAFRESGPRFWRGAGRWAARLFLVSAAAQFALSPLLIHYFHRLSFVGLVSNMFAVPWAAVCLSLGVALFGVDVLFGNGFPTTFLAAVTEKAVLGLWRGVAFFAGWPGAEMVISWNNGQVFALAAAVSVTLVVLAARRRGGKWVLAVWAVALPFFWAGGRPSDRALTVTWLDVGLGDAVVVVSPSRRVTVIDGGSSASAAHRLVPYLRSRGIARIDRLILTHADPPHAGGLRAVLKEFPVGEFLCGAATWRSSVWAEGRELIEDRGVPHRFVEANDAWEEDGVRWRLLAPVPSDPPDPDSQGLVVHLEFGETSALLTADVPVSLQRRLAGVPPSRLTVMQWPHHGRAFPDFDFLAAKNPRWFVVSGDRPKGFVESFSLGGSVRSTALHGSLEWRSDGIESRLRSLRPPPTDVFRAVVPRVPPL